MYKFSGLNLDEILEEFTDETLAESSRQAEKKNKLKTELQKLSGKVPADTKQPLVWDIT